MPLIWRLSILRMELGMVKKPRGVNTDSGGAKRPLPQDTTDSEQGSIGTSQEPARIRNLSGRFARYQRILSLSKNSGVAVLDEGENQELLKREILWDIAPKQEYFDELFRVSKNQIIWGANYFPNMPPTRCFIVWRKLTISEKFTMAMAEYAWTSFAQNAKVYEVAPQGKKSDPRFHPTQKPVELYAWLIRQFAQPGDKILDTHLGSGSSRIAAYQMGFDFVGCEIDSDYFAKSQARFERECLGIKQDSDGTTIQQLSLF